MYRYDIIMLERGNCLQYFKNSVVTLHDSLKKTHI